MICCPQDIDGRPIGKGKALSNISWSSMIAIGTRRGGMRIHTQWTSEIHLEDECNTLIMDVVDTRRGGIQHTHNGCRGYTQRMNAGLK